MSTARLAIRGVLFNWLGKGCAIATTFFVTPIVIHGLGNEVYGVWTMIMSVGAYYALANLGLRAAGVKYISQFDALDDHESVNKVVVTMLISYLPLAAIVLLLACCIALFFPAFVVAKSLTASTITWVIVVAGLSVSVGIVGQVFEATLVAFKRFDKINVLAVVAQLLQATLIVIAIQSGFGLFAMASIILLVMIIRQLCTYFLAVQTVENLSLSVRFFKWPILRMLLGFGTRNVGVAMARRVINYGGAIIIGVILGPVSVAFYAIAQSLALRLEDLGKGMNSVLMPVVSQLNAQNRQVEMANVFFLASRTLLAIGIAVAAVFIFLGQPLIAMWIGPDYASWSYPVLCVLAVSMVIRLPKHSAANVLKGTGRVDCLVKIAMIEVVLVLALGIFLVRGMGILGMGYAVLVAEILGACLLLPVTCRISGTFMSSYLYKVCIPGVLASIPSVAVAFGISLLIPPSHLIHVILQAIGVMTVSGATVFFVCFDRRIQSDILGHFVPSQLSYLLIRAEEQPITIVGKDQSQT